MPLVGMLSLEHIGSLDSRKNVCLFYPPWHINHAKLP